MQNDDLVPERISHLTAVNSSSWRRTAIAIFITAIITGASGYLFGARNMQAVSHTTTNTIVTSNTNYPTLSNTFALFGFYTFAHPKTTYVNHQLDDVYK
jgi:hypothetical protein